VMATAALEENIVNHSPIHCSGQIHFGKRDFRCWRRAGTLGEPAHRSGAIVRRLLLPGRAAPRHRDDRELRAALRPRHADRRPPRARKGGTIPDSAWKRQRFKEPWYAGETLSVSIGQGYVTTTRCRWRGDGHSRHRRALPASSGQAHRGAGQLDRAELEPEKWRDSRCVRRSSSRCERRPRRGQPAPSAPERRRRSRTSRSPARRERRRWSRSDASAEGQSDTVEGTRPRLVHRLRAGQARIAIATLIEHSRRRWRRGGRADHSAVLDAYFEFQSSGSRRAMLRLTAGWRPLDGRFSSSRWP
jgi:hypothetical protein